MVFHWIQSSVIEPLKKAFSEGLTPHTIALSFACGLVGGIFPLPFPGAAFFVCMGFIVAFGLNIPICQVISALITPVQLMLVIPFVRLGEFLFQVQKPLTADDLWNEISEDLVGAATKFGSSLGVAIVAWAVTAVVLIPIFYLIILGGVTRVRKSEQKARRATNPYLKQKSRRGV